MGPEGFLTVTTDALLKVSDLRESRVLATCSEEVAQLVERDASVAALVEERERFFVVGRGLVLLRCE